MQRENSEETVNDSVTRTKKKQETTILIPQLLVLSAGKPVNRHNFKSNKRNFIKLSSLISQRRKIKSYFLLVTPHNEIKTAQAFTKLMA